VVVLAGGEPLLHKDLPEIVRGAIARASSSPSCTNALAAGKNDRPVPAEPYFNWSIHLDGDRQMHDKSVCQKGVYDRAVSAIRAAKQRGFRVNINCTLFNDADPRAGRPVFRRCQSAGRGRHNGLAGLCLRA